jgi:hypothetical protein
VKDCTLGVSSILDFYVKKQKLNPFSVSTLEKKNLRISTVSRISTVIDLVYYPKKRGPFFLLELEPKLGYRGRARYRYSNKARSNSWISTSPTEVAEKNLVVAYGAIHALMIKRAPGGPGD